MLGLWSPLKPPMTCAQCETWLPKFCSSCAGWAAAGPATESPPTVIATTIAACVSFCFMVVLLGWICWIQDDSCVSSGTSRETLISLSSTGTRPRVRRSGGGIKTPLGTTSTAILQSVVLGPNTQLDSLPMAGVIVVLCRRTPLERTSVPTHRSPITGFDSRHRWRRVEARGPVAQAGSS